MFPNEKRKLHVWLERRPVAADKSVTCYDGLEDAPVVVGFMAELRRQYYVAALISYEVLVVGWNKQIASLTEAPGATVLCQIEVPAFPSFGV